MVLANDSASQESARSAEATHAAFQHLRLSRGARVHVASLYEKSIFDPTVDYEIELFRQLGKLETYAQCLAVQSLKLIAQYQPVDNPIPKNDVALRATR